MMMDDSEISRSISLTISLTFSLTPCVNFVTLCVCVCVFPNEPSTVDLKPVLYHVVSKTLFQVRNQFRN